MAKSLKDRIIYGGVTKEEYDSIQGLISEENHRVWRLLSIILEILFIGLFVFVLLEPNHSSYVAPLGILAGMMISSVLAFLVILKPSSKALLPFIYVTIVVLLVSFIYIGVYVEKTRPTAAFPILLVAIPFLTIDRPIRSFLFTIAHSALFIVLAIFVKKDPAVLLSDILIVSLCTFAGILISLFTTSLRINDLVLKKTAEEERDTDALTNVANKLAYDRKVDEIRKKMKEPGFKFAVAIFDVNGLKMMNDTYGHDEGNKLLIRCCDLIKEAFPNTIIYRIGGDEFAAIITGEDYTNRERLLRELYNKLEDIHNHAKSLKDDTSVALGVAIFNPKQDRDYLSVFSRADAQMYDNKRVTKAKNKYLQGN